MRARRRSTGSDLPHAPLLMLHPLAVPGAQVPGREIVREIRTPVGALLYALHWAALSWSYSGTPAPQLAEVERDALARMGEGECWAAIAVLAGQLAGSEPAEPGEMAHACHCIADWALAREARDTAIAFMILAALVFPRHPRYAWAAGRMLRTHGRMREAEAWLHRAERVAVWNRDAQTRALALNSLGVLAHVTGNNAKAVRRLCKALELATTHDLDVIEGEVLHDLVVVETDRKQFAIAEEYAARALAKYLPSHPRIPALAHDTAYLWMEQGFFERALPVLKAVVPSLEAAREQFQTCAAMARAAGGAKDEVTFRWAWRAAFEHAGQVPDGQLRAGAFLDLGRGASSLGQWADSVTAFQRAAEIARIRGENDVVFKAEAALKVVYREQKADVRGQSGPVVRSADAFARQMLCVLQPALCA